MASADVTLKEGLSYTISDGPHQYKFVPEKATPVTGADFIDRLKTISCLIVAVHEDKPVVPLKAVPKAKVKLVAPDPIDVPEPEPEDTGDEDEQTGEVTDGEQTEGEETTEGTDDEAPVDELVEEEPEELPPPPPVKAVKAKPGKAKGK